MKKENITVSMEQEKLRAIKRYMAKKNVNIQAELEESLQKLYEKYVPAPVRAYIDETAIAESPSRRNVQSTEE